MVLVWVSGITYSSPFCQGETNIYEEESEQGGAYPAKYLHTGNAAARATVRARIIASLITVNILKHICFSTVVVILSSAYSESAVVAVLATAADRVRIVKSHYFSL